MRLKQGVYLNASVNNELLSEKMFMVFANVKKRINGNKCMQLK